MSCSIQVRGGGEGEEKRGERRKEEEEEGVASNYFQCYLPKKRL